MIGITICGHDFELSYDDIVEDNHELGMSSLRRGTVLLRSDLPPDIEHSTLLHEIVHQICDLHSITLPNEETTIDVIAMGILNFIRHNDTLINSLRMRVSLKTFIGID